MSLLQLVRKTMQITFTDQSTFGNDGFHAERRCQDDSDEVSAEKSDKSTTIKLALTPPVAGADFLAAWKE